MLLTQYFIVIKFGKKLRDIDLLELIHTNNSSYVQAFGISYSLDIFAYMHFVATKRS